MAKCPGCGAELPIEARDCYACGCRVPWAETPARSSRERALGGIAGTLNVLGALLVAAGSLGGLCELVERMPRSGEQFNLWPAVGMVAATVVGVGLLFLASFVRSFRGR